MGAIEVKAFRGKCNNCGLNTSLFFADKEEMIIKLITTGWCIANSCDVMFCTNCYTATKDGIEMNPF